jgi:hypothetical protein
MQRRATSREQKTESKEQRAESSCDTGIDNDAERKSEGNTARECRRVESYQGVEMPSLSWEEKDVWSYARAERQE